ncbi:FIST C-terminal domain-containing protein [Gemmobacter fulvus]|uniref:FIST C-terminal domain-containing protein n=1 Tax=Gemmobacter fulvus TaxID=2840474 RepID=A0A975P680_9RHOB|nr:FIST N-terminal domain-containing protein [Gemmobacter fulvus]MBT9245270.1 FIST C-terminal domain-containing protein [Gemmobacter fulvus]MDQ1848140.1 FIST N-terminal domain-containing protein [Gemmobacter fulvus]QWK90404.1 FIST C-terminal domain-containing protein [Gemmobacter fulvus]
MNDGPVIVTAHVDARSATPAARLAAALGPGPFACVMLFISPEADLAALLAEAAFDAPVIGCTTAGEISGEGYSEGGIVALGLPAAYFAADILLIPDLVAIDSEDLIGRLIRARQGLRVLRPGWDHEFAFLMVDGLSTREDALTAALAAGLGPVPLFGGSAADGTRFRETFVVHDGRALRNAAVLAMVRSRCRVKVFNLDHLVPTETRMVVTEADPANRTVRQINAEPAAREYARLLGKDPGQLDTFTFAAHPVVVRIGGRHHVRAIQQVAPNGDLVFFSAIDEGLVLTLAEPEDMVAHLERELAGLAIGTAPEAILACDCILRRMEALEKQKYGAVSAILRDNNVVGFSTYGEQLNSMHVNQTMTGVAIFPPGV